MFSKNIFKIFTCFFVSLFNRFAIFAGYLHFLQPKKVKITKGEIYKLLFGFSSNQLFSYILAACSKTSSSSSSSQNESFDFLFAPVASLSSFDEFAIAF